jgi:hypothetical protein
LDVSQSAVQAHLDHGDFVGDCEQVNDPNFVAPTPNFQRQTRQLAAGDGTCVSQDPNCSKIPGGCRAKVVISADWLRDYNRGPVETEVIGNLLASTPKMAEYVINKSTWSCIWDKIIDKHEGPQSFPTDPNGPNFSSKMLEEMIAQVTRLIVKYSQGDWANDDNAIRLVALLNEHLSALVSELEEVNSGVRPIGITDIFMTGERKAHKEKTMIGENQQPVIGENQQPVIGENQQCCAEDIGFCPNDGHTFSIPILDLALQGADRPTIDRQIGSDYGRFVKLPMFNGGKNGISGSPLVKKGRIATAYLAYDCSSDKVCAAAQLDSGFLTANPTVYIQTLDEESWIRFGANGAGKLTQSNADEFSYLYSNTGSVIGYEGCWSSNSIGDLDRITNNIVEVHFNLWNGDTTSTGKMASDGKYICVKPQCVM